MKALVLHGKHQVEIENHFPEPPMGPDCVKIAVAYCGLCGTDIHKYEGKGGSRPVVYPVPLGHEASGIIVETGENVRDLKPGDRVAVDPNWFCKSCWFCQNGLTHFCENSRGVVKGFAEYICPPQENVYKLPDSLSLKDAALAEPLSCCLHGMDLLDLKAGQAVVIIGFGSIGSIFLQLCRRSGASRCIIVEPQEQKRELAMRLGASLFINPEKANAAEEIRRAGIPNVDRVIECVGLKSTMASALEIAGKGATVLLFGLGEAGDPMPFDQYAAFQKELTVKTSFINPASMGRALALLETGVIEAEPLISGVLDMEEMAEELKNRTLFRKGKVLLKVFGEGA